MALAAVGCGVFVFLLLNGVLWLYQVARRAMGRQPGRGRRRAAAAILAGSTAVAVGPRAHAAASVHLVHSRAPGAESHARTKEDLRRAVAARVGYDPFFAWARKTVVSTMAPDDRGGFVANVMLVDEQGREHGARVLHTDGACDELRDATALTIAIAIDPHSLVAPASPSSAPTASPSPVPPPAPSTPASAPEPVIAAPAERAVIACRATPFGPARARDERRCGRLLRDGAIAARGPLVGGVVALGMAVAEASKRGWTRPATVPARGDGQVTTWLGSATLLVCGHTGPVFACGLWPGRLAGVVGGGRDECRSSTDPWVAAGGRFGVLVPFARAASFRVPARPLEIRS